MANVYFYVDSDDIGVVVESASGTDAYAPINSAAVLKIWGSWDQPDIDTGTANDGDSYDLINARQHVGILYKVLAEIFPGERHWERKYEKVVGRARKQNNPFATGRIRQWDF